MDRRGFLLGGGAVAGDGLVRPLNAPPPRELTPGIQPGAASPVVTAVRVVVYGTSQSAILVYNPGPGAGNLVASFNGATGFVDSYGNHVIGGAAEYSGTDAVSLIAGAVQHYTGSLAGGWTADSGVIVTANQITLRSSSQQILQAGNTQLLTAGPVVIAAPGSPTAGEPWHSMTLLNSWANTAGFQAARYRLVASPPNSVQVQGVIASTAATSTTFATLPAGYVPATAQGFSVGATANVPAGSAPQVRCDTSGNLTINGGPAFPSTVSWFFNGFVSLD